MDPRPDKISHLGDSLLTPREGRQTTGSQAAPVLSRHGEKRSVSAGIEASEHGQSVSGGDVGGPLGVSSARLPATSAACAGRVPRTGTPAVSRPRDSSTGCVGTPGGACIQSDRYICSDSARLRGGSGSATLRIDRAEFGDTVARTGSHCLEGGRIGATLSGRWVLCGRVFMGSANIQGDLWGREPGDWAELQEVLHAPLWEAMFDATGVAHGSRVLDAGCGGGGASVLAARRGALVSGLDASEPLVEVARNRIPEGDFRVGDLETLPFADGSFDAVIAASSVQYAEDRVAALRELARVTAADGLISVGLWSTPDRVDYRVVFAAVRDALPEPPQGDGPFGLSEPGILEGLIEAAGMRVISNGEADCPFTYRDSETFWKANISAGPLQGVMEIVGEDELRTAVMESAEPYRTDDGGFRFENAFRYVTAKPST